jgi:hypothetical protein
MVWHSNARDRPKSTIRILDWSGFRRGTVFKWSICVRLSNGPVFKWHPKTGQILSDFRIVPANLDRFINKTVIKRIFLFLKRSRLEVKKLPVRFLNAYSHSKTGQICPVFKFSAILLPFENWTPKVSRNWPFKNRTVRFSDVDCIQVMGMILIPEN